MFMEINKIWSIYFPHNNIDKVLDNYKIKFNQN